MTVRQALKEVRQGIIPGKRGAACAAVIMEDGRQFGVTNTGHASPAIVLCSFADGEMTVHDAKDVKGEVDKVSWSCDASGARFGN